MTTGATENSSGGSLLDYIYMAKVDMQEQSAAAAIEYVVCDRFVGYTLILYILDPIWPASWITSKIIYPCMSL